MEDRLEKGQDRSTAQLMTFVNYLGVDQGQAQDRFAVALVERVIKIADKRALPSMVTYRDEPQVWLSELHCTYYKRFPRRTPYTEAVTWIERYLMEPGLYHQTALIVDCTRERATADVMMSRGLWPVPVVITSGKRLNVDDYGWHNVPEMDLLNAIVIAAEKSRLHVTMEVAPGGITAEDAAEMERQLEHLHTRVSKLRAIIGMGVPESEGNDDLAFALAMAVWYADRDGGGIPDGIKGADTYEAFDVLEGK